MNDKRRLADGAKAAALDAGFDAAGVCGLAPITRGALEQWLARGYAASMRYMHRQAARRAAPQAIVPAARSAVVVLESYHQPDPFDGKPAARVARYAWGEDYHRVLEEKLRRLVDRLIELGSSRASTLWYVDAGPVPERELAARAGLGWIAKNTMLIHPRLGSFTFIATVFTDLELEEDRPLEVDHCGSCRLCLDACPTAAFPAERVLDAGRCISYLTIERRGPFDAQSGELIGDWLFGCDVCQDVCPWNSKFAAPTKEPRFTARREIVRPDLEALASMDDGTFRELYAGTAFERPGRDGMSRNARQVRLNGPAERSG